MDRLSCRGFTAGLLRGRGVAEEAVVERRLRSMPLADFPLALTGGRLLDRVRGESDSGRDRRPSQGAYHTKSPTLGS
jgi:hypothetical protein